MKRAMQRWGDYWRPRGVILMYHRVGAALLDPFDLCVTIERFEAHLKVIQRVAPVVSMAELARGLAERHLPRRFVAVTFDDGYLDNLTTAKPLLVKAGVPATVHVPAGLVGEETGFWWDRCIAFLLQPGTIPVKLSARLGGAVRSWNAASCVDYTEAEHAADRAWKFGMAVRPGSRLELFVSTYNFLKELGAEARAHVLSQWLPGAVPLAAAETGRIMNAAELRMLEAGGLMTVGGHTVSHVRLSSLSRLQQVSEITGCKRLLEEYVGHPIGEFSYPHGEAADYSADTVACVREAGFRCACTALPAALTVNADLLQLPRVMVLNWDATAFEDALKRWFTSLG